MPQFPPGVLAIALLSLVLFSSILAAWGWLISRVALGRPVLPVRPPTIVPWNGKTLIGVMLVYMGLRFILPDFYFYVLLGRKVGVKFDITPMDKLMVTSLINMLFLPLAWLVLRRFSGAKLSDLGLVKGRVGMDTLRGIIAWPILAPIVFGLNFFILFSLNMKDVRQAHPLEQMAGENPSPLIWVMLFFSAIVAAPLAEEFLFRGVLLGWLGKTMSGAKVERIEGSDSPWHDESVMPPLEEPVETVVETVETPGHPLGWFLANLTISLIFALLHIDAWPAPIPLFFLALGLGVLFQRTGGLVAPIALHMMFNGISTVVLLISSLSGGMDALKQELQKGAPVAPQVIKKPADVAK